MTQAKKQTIAEAVEMACLLEASSEKPGNVTPTRQFDDLTYSHFLHAAVALGSVFRTGVHKGVGEIILACVKRCAECGGSNVNLGVILLLAPLAKTYYRRECVDVENVRGALASLTVKDAENAYEAIRIANPGGLGHVGAHDVRKKPAITLLRAMKLASGRDWIAHEYANAFDITFTVGVPDFTDNLDAGMAFREAVVQTYLKLLYLYPDSHIARRTSPETALKISEKAGAVLKKGGLRSPAGRRAVYDFDHYLRTSANRYNPGTTADLIASTLMVHFLKHGYSSLHRTK